MTTLGYGDIVPRNEPFDRVIMILFALVGAAVIATAISELVIVAFLRVIAAANNTQKLLLIKSNKLVRSLSCSFF